MMHTHQYNTNDTCTHLVSILSAWIEPLCRFPMPKTGTGHGKQLGVRSCRWNSGEGLQRLKSQRQFQFLLQTLLCHKYHWLLDSMFQDFALYLGHGAMGINFINFAHSFAYYGNDIVGRCCFTFRTSVCNRRCNTAFWWMLMSLLYSYVLKRKQWQEFQSAFEPLSLGRYWGWVPWNGALWDLESHNRRQLDHQWISVLPFSEESRQSWLYPSCMSTL